MNAKSSKPVVMPENKSDQLNKNTNKTKKSSKPIDGKDGNKIKKENKSKVINKELNQANSVIAQKPVTSEDPKPTRALNDPRYKNE
jgi:hypothetical protein